MNLTLQSNFIYCNQFLSNNMGISLSTTNNGFLTLTSLVYHFNVTYTACFAIAPVYIFKFNICCKFFESSSSLNLFKFSTQHETLVCLHHYPPVICNQFKMYRQWTWHSNCIQLHCHLHCFDPSNHQCYLLSSFYLQLITYFHQVYIFLASMSDILASETLGYF